MKKHSKVLVAIAVISSMFTVTAYAKDIRFDIKRDTNQSAESASICVAHNTKDRIPDSWLITNSNSSYSTFVSGQDAIGFRVRSTETGGNGTAMSDYFVVKTFVTNRAYVYTKVPDRGHTVYLHALVDSTSKHKSFWYDGKWFT